MRSSCTPSQFRGRLRPNTTAPRSTDNISAVAAVADYHVVLWTSVALVVILLGVLYSMLAMGDAPLDSQLRAQVVDKRASTSAKSK